MSMKTLPETALKSFADLEAWVSGIPGTPVEVRRIGDFLLQAAYLTEAELEAAIAYQNEHPGKLIGEILVEQKVLTADQVTWALCEKLQIPIVDLDLIKPDPSLAFEIPETLCRELSAIPVGIMKGRLVVAMTNPTDEKQIDSLGFHASRPIMAVMAREEDIQWALLEMYDLRAENLPDAQGQEATTKIYGHRVERTKRDGLAVRLVDHVLRTAVEREASDIHISPGIDTVTISYRVDGILKEARRMGKAFFAYMVNRVKVMGKMDTTITRRPQDGHIRGSFENLDVDFRVSTMPSAYGENLVIRVLNQSELPPSPKGLGFDEEDLALWERLMNQSQGFVLVTGPTGSGKTTTLASSLLSMACDGRNILTLEDPIEYRLPGVAQMEVDPEHDFSFSVALKHALRQDPDVIMVGEVRDQVTAKIGIEAAMTGHLVLSTLHTIHAPGAVARLLEMGVPDYLLRSALSAVLSQRLVRKLCPYCKEPDPDPPKGFAKGKVMRATGCVRCGHTGHKGRTLIYELLPVTKEFREHIATGVSAEELLAIANAQGFKSMLRRLAGLVLRGEVSVREWLRLSRLS